jgi:carboxymethylenebutenolidase
MNPATRALAIVLTAGSLAVAQTTRPALPADANRAADALKTSPRHGEWQDISLPGGGKLHTFVVHPERSDKAPVVIVIHEIFGMTDWVRAVADQLAAEGFIAVAPDLLSGKGPDGGNTDSFASGDVRAAIQKLTPDEVAGRLDAAKDFATKLPNATANVGVVGFCWGGTQTFNYAVRQPDLKAGVVYYGSGPKEAAGIAKITAPILGQYGGDDARVTSTVEPTKRQMADAGKAYEPIVHAGAGHGFLRQQEGRDGANLRASQAAWERTIAFFKEKLGG